MNGENSKIFFEKLKENNTINTLIMSDCKMDEKAFSNLNEALKKNRKIKKIDLSFNRIDFRCASYLFDSLKFNSCLEEIFLFNCYLDSRVFSVLHSCLVRNVHLNPSFTLSSSSSVPSSLVSIKLNYNRLKIFFFIFFFIFFYFFYLLLFFFLNSIDEESSSYLSEIISECKIETLYLGNTYLSFNSISKLFGTISYNKTLTELDISHNNLDGKIYYFYFLNIFYFLFFIFYFF